jgi:hypothetical protein
MQKELEIRFEVKTLFIRVLPPGILVLLDDRSSAEVCIPWLYLHDVAR